MYAVRGGVLVGVQQTNSQQKSGAEEKKENGVSGCGEGESERLRAS